MSRVRHAAGRTASGVSEAVVSRRSGLAVGAGAEDIQGVDHVAEVVLGADLVGPALDGRPLDLDRPPAEAADQVMVVVAGAAPPIDGLTITGPHHVHLTVGGHRLK